MEQIPMPIILDPQRPRLEGQLSLDDANQQAHDLEKALWQAADYGRYLWRQVDAVRHYLLEVAPDPDAVDEAARVFAAPRGPDDDHGWDRWKTAYEAVTMVLAGPTGDSGFGRHEAAQEALRRRGPVHASDRTAELVQVAEARAAAVEEQRGTTPEDVTPPVSTPDPQAAVPDAETEPASTTAPRVVPHFAPRSQLNVGTAGLIAAAVFTVGIVTGRRAGRRDRARLRAGRTRER